MRWLASVVVVVLFGGGLSWADAPADERELSRAARTLAGDLMSPFCPGRTLSDCPSPDAQAVRDEIRGWLAAGQSEREIREQLGRRFGDELVGVPRSAWGWLLPIAILVAGALGLAIGFSRIGRRPAPRELPPELEAELSRELDQQ